MSNVDIIAARVMDGVSAALSDLNKIVVMKNTVEEGERKRLAWEREEEYNNKMVNYKQSAIYLTMPPELQKMADDSMQKGGYGATADGWIKNKDLKVFIQDQHQNDLFMQTFYDGAKRKNQLETVDAFKAWQTAEMSINPKDKEQAPLLKNKYEQLLSAGEILNGHAAEDNKNRTATKKMKEELANEVEKVRIMSLEQAAKQKYQEGVIRNAEGRVTAANTAASKAEAQRLADAGFLAARALKKMVNDTDDKFSAQLQVVRDKYGDDPNSKPMLALMAERQKVMSGHIDEVVDEFKDYGVTRETLTRGPGFEPKTGLPKLYMGAQPKTAKGARERFQEATTPETPKTPTRYSAPGTTPATAIDPGFDPAGGAPTYVEGGAPEPGTEAGDIDPYSLFKNR